jgi:hypothetical protein
MKPWSPGCKGGWQQRGKRILVCPLGAILLCSALTGVGHTFLLGDWNPFLSHDTHYFYGQTLTPLNQPGWPGYRALFVKPFFRPASEDWPLADEAKPVFVCALRLWHMGWKRWVRPDVVFPDARAYVAFVIATCVLAFASLCLLGWKLGRPGVGILTGFAVLWGPWGLSACYFTTYTAFSLALFCAAVVLLLCRPATASLAAGILVSLCLLSNQSLLACLPALPLFILLHKGREGRWKAGRALGAFALGVILPFTICEILGLTGCVQALVGPAVQTPLGILQRYLARSRVDHVEFLPAFRRSFFLILSYLNSRVLTVAGAGILLALAGSVLWWAWRGKAAGLLRKLADPEMQNSLLVLLPGLAALAVIDGRTGFKFSRSYFLALPFLVLGLSHLGLCLVRGLPSRLVRAGVVCLVLLGCGEGFWRVRDFYQAFQGVPKALRSLTDRPGQAVALEQDVYTPFLANMADVVSIDDDQPIPDRASYLVTGPALPSALEYTTGQMDFADYFRRHSLRLALAREVPFFALYPFLVYEDPSATFGLEVQHLFDRRTYCEGSGTVKIWRVMR